MKRDRPLQIRLLKSARGDEPKEDFSDLDPQFVSYNAALLINDGMVEGDAIRDHTGTYCAAVITGLTSAGHDLLDSLEDQTLPTPTIPPSTTMVDIFISHSSEDVELAKKLTELVQRAFAFSAEAIRCTSVPGFKFKTGADAKATIRAEIGGSKAFIGLLTPASIRSTFVLFELGARWGQNLPLYAAYSGITPKDLPAPINDGHAQNLSVRSDVNQLLDDLAELLARRLERRALFDGLIDELVAISQAVKAPSRGLSSATDAKDAIPDLPAKAWDVLTFLFERNVYVDISSIQRHISEGHAETEHYVDVLRAQQLASKQLPVMGAMGHMTSMTAKITAPGRALVMKRRELSPP